MPPSAPLGHHGAMLGTRGFAPLALTLALAGGPGLAAPCVPLPSVPTLGTPPGDPPGNRVDYTIEARVDTGPMTLAGSETVRFTNRTDTPTAELWFHLYWNAFSSHRSTHLTESGGKLRGVAIDEGWGWQRLTQLRAQDTDLLPTLTVETPDDDNEFDRTVVRCTLPREVKPGETLEIELAWEAQIPRVRRRTGYKGNFLFLAQWFPKLGVFEGARGWNCHQFHASTEFYSDYGAYDVTLDLPKEYEKKIGATGVLAGPPQLAGERVRTRFVAPGQAELEQPEASAKTPWVHDFAWTADPDFKRFTRTFHFDAWLQRFDVEVAAVQKALGPKKNLRLRDVDVMVLVQPERERQWERHYEAACAALFFYGLWFGEYPHSHITVVDPAWGAGAAGGMEYPTLVTGGTRLWPTERSHVPEGVVVHETGHQFWYGLVGNNEFESGWLDEGFNSFSDSETLVRAFGRSYASTDFSGVPLEGVAPVPGPSATGLAGALAGQAIPLPWLDWDLKPLAIDGAIGWWRDQPLVTYVQQSSDPRDNDRVRALSALQLDPLDSPSFRHADQRSYALNSYTRTALALRTLSGLVGRDKFLAGMRHYSETWRYRHPYPQDFFDTFCAGAGVDVQWFFESVFRGTGTVDWSVTVEQAREREPKGFAQLDATSVPTKLGAAPTAENAPENAENGGEAASEGKRENAARAERPWKAVATVVRRGELRLPVEIELTFDDGTRERRTWTREEQERKRWLKLEHTGAKKLASVRVDPDGLVPLDLDRSNDAWFDVPDGLAPVRWSERAFQRWLQLLHWQAGIGG